MSAPAPRRSRFSRAVLFHNGSIGDCLMLLYLAQLLHEGGIPEVAILSPRGQKFFAELVGSYPFVSVQAVSSRRPERLLSLAAARGAALVALPPTFGHLPLTTKLAGFFLSRRRGSLLVGFQDKGPLCSWYGRTLSFDTSKLFPETMLDVARAAGISANAHVPRLAIEPDDSVLDELGLRGARYLVLHPRGSSEARSFSRDDIAELVAGLLRADAGRRVVVSAGAEDAPLVAEAMVGLNGAVVAGGLSPRRLAALILHAERFIGMDTGVTHLACFLGVSVWCVTHAGTAVCWLPYYAPGARVLYRLVGEDRAREDREYLKAHSGGRLKPFDRVSVAEVLTAESAGTS